MTNLPITGEFNVTATFGQKGKYWSSVHKGIDITCSNRTIYATCDGTVRVVGFDKDGWGRYVTVKSDDGTIHIFCHLVNGSVEVKSGQRVNRLTKIGIMGTTGNSTGVHLHFQINNANGQAINPCEYLRIPNKTGKYNSKDYEIGGDNMYFKDEKNISAWARDEVKKVFDAEIMLGDEKGNFNPKKNITREEVAVIIAKLLEKK